MNRIRRFYIKDLLTGDKYYVEGDAGKIMEELVKTYPVRFKLEEYISYGDAKAIIQSVKIKYS